MANLGFLASGRGSNFAAIVAAIEAGAVPARAAVLVSDRKNARAIELATAKGIPAYYFPYDRNNRRDFEERAADALRGHDCDLVCLAGYMRLLTPWFIRQFPNRILNIHPALLPAFKGVNAQAQAVAAGVKVSGCTVHLVTEELDSGPILGRREVPVLEGDTAETLAARILVEEHKLYPQMIAKWIQENLAT